LLLPLGFFPPVSSKKHSFVQFPEFFCSSSEICGFP
jgi:hypothetical protein